MSREDCFTQRADVFWSVIDEDELCRLRDFDWVNLDDGDDDDRTNERMNEWNGKADSMEITFRNNAKYESSSRKWLFAASKKPGPDIDMMKQKRMSHENRD